MLCDLPNEILLQIFRLLVVLQFDKHSLISTSLDRPRINGLASICSACKRLRLVAEPVLYSTIVCKEVSPQSEGSNGPNHRLRSSLRTIISRPDLANHVKTITLRQFGHPGQLAGTLNSHVGVPNQDLVRLYQEASARTSLGKLQDSWCCALRAGDLTAEITLLNTLLPKVTDVNLLCPLWFPTTTPPFYMAHLLEAIKPRVPHGPSFGIFTSIERLTVSNWTSDETATGIPIWCLSKLMLLPTLRRIHCIGAREDHNNTGWTCSHRASNVSDVILTNSLVGAAGLELFINSCAALKIFNFEYTYSNDFNHFGARDVDWQRVGNALREHPNTLQALILDAEDQSPNAIATWMKFPQPIGSLQNFDTLRSICIHQWILLGRDIWHEVEGNDSGYVSLIHDLPQSLVELKVLQCTQTIIPQLQALCCTVLEGGFRDLATIYVDWDQWHEETTQTSDRASQIVFLARSFAERGIKWEDGNRRVFRADKSLSKYNPSRAL